MKIYPDLNKAMRAALPSMQKPKMEFEPLMVLCIGVFFGLLVVCMFLN